MKDVTSSVDDTDFKNRLEKLNTAQGARELLTKINLKGAEFLDGQSIKIEDMDDESVISTANQAVKFAMQVFVALKEGNP